MNALLNAHVGGRLVAIIAGVIAIAAPTNGPLHTSCARLVPGRYCRLVVSMRSISTRCGSGPAAGPPS